MDNLITKVYSDLVKKALKTLTHPDKMAHSYAKANRKRYFVSIVIPLRVCTSAHSEDQKECQQYFNPHRLSRGHTGAWDCRTQGSAFLVRCDVFQYC